MVIAGYRNNVPNYEDTLDKIIQAVEDADMVVLNDLGKEKYTEKRLESIFIIVDTICENNTPCVVTINPSSLSKMENLEDLTPIIDRIKELCAGNIIKNEGTSYRELMAERGQKSNGTV